MVLVPPPPPQKKKKKIWLHHLEEKDSVLEMVKSNFEIHDTLALPPLRGVACIDAIVLFYNGV